MFDDEAVLADEQAIESKQVLPNTATVGRAPRAGPGRGPHFAEQVLDVNGEIQLRELGLGEMQYVMEAPLYRMRQKTTPTAAQGKPSLCAMREGGSVRASQRSKSALGGVKPKSSLPSPIADCATTSRRSSHISRLWRWRWQRMWWNRSSWRRVKWER